MIGLLFDVKVLLTCCHSPHEYSSVRIVSQKLRTESLIKPLEPVISHNFPDELRIFHLFILVNLGHTLEQFHGHCQG